MSDKRQINLVMIVSGGQTGADRAALDWAIEQDIPHGGWCPKGRRAEDGPIASRYRLKETRRSDWKQRTEWNVRDSGWLGQLNTPARYEYRGEVATKRSVAKRKQTRAAN